MSVEPARVYDRVRRLSSDKLPHAKDVTGNFCLLAAAGAAAVATLLTAALAPVVVVLEFALGMGRRFEE